MALAVLFLVLIAVSIPAATNPGHRRICIPYVLPGNYVSIMTGQQQSMNFSIPWVAHHFDHCYNTNEVMLTLNIYHITMVLLVAKNLEDFLL